MMLPREIDRMEIHVLGDFECDFASPAPKFNYTPEMLQLLEREAHKCKERGLKESANKMGASSMCCASTDFSYLIDVWVGDEKHTFLFDCGISKNTVENARKQELDLSGVECIALSHRHFDHTGGLIPTLDEIHKHRKEKNTNTDLLGARSTADESVPIYAHPLVQCEYGFTHGGCILLAESVADPEEIKQHGGTWNSNKDKKLIMDDIILLSGEIPRVTEYELGFPNQVRKENGQWIDDPSMPEEQFLILRIKNKGLVVFSACSHAGIVNVVTHACRNLAPDLPLFLVMGGFHLIGMAYEKIMGRTVSDLLSFKPQFVCAGHCTGYKAKAELRKALGDNYHITPVGCRYVFTSD